MQLTYKNILGIGALAVLIVAIAILAVVLRSPENVEGSVTKGSEGLSTTTPQLANNTTLCVGPGVLHDVNVMAMLTGKMDFVDASTTNVSLRGGIGMPTATSSLYIATLPAGTGTSTLQYDALFRWGLTVNYTGAVSTTTFMYTCYQ